MSTITVTNIKATGETASRAVSGVAAAWVSFNGTSPSVRGSQNVSSVVDFGTGDHQVNITNAMANGNYATTAACGPTAALGGSNNVGVSFQTDNTPPAASLFRPVTRRRDNSTDSDVSYAFSAAFGDLA